MFYCILFIFSNKCAIKWREFVSLLLLYAIATVIQLYHDSDMMYEMGRRKSEATLLQTQGIFNLPHVIGMVWEEPAFQDTVSYTQRRNGLHHS